MADFDLSARAMLAGLRISSWGGTRLDKQETGRVAEHNGASADAVRVVKDLVGDALDDVRSSERGLREAHRSLTLPWGDDSTRMLTTAAFSRYQDTVRPLIDRHLSHVVPGFVEAYQREVIPRARDRLGMLFNPDDFPADVSERFDAVLTFLPIPNRSDVRVSLSDAEVAALREHVAEATRNAIVSAQRDVVARAVAPLSRLAEALREYGPGRRLASSLFDNVREIGELLPELDVTNSQEIADIASQLRSLASVDVRSVRQDGVARHSVANSADALVSKLAGIF